MTKPVHKKSIINHFTHFINQIEDSHPTSLVYLAEYEDGERVPYTIDYIGSGPIYLTQNLQYLEMDKGKYPVFMIM